MSKHAIFAPSTAHRWLNCTGSTALEADEPDNPSEDADHGTAAHFLAAECLRTNRDPAQYFKKEIAVWVHPESDSEGADWLDAFKGRVELGLEIRNQFTVDEEMVGAVRRYVHLVRELAGASELLIEQELPIAHLTGEDGAAGTGDAVILEGDRITVIDLKYGANPNNVVSAEFNPQLKMYLFGALHAYALLGEFTRFRAVISQPRLFDQPSVWEGTFAELHNFPMDALQAADDARLAQKHIVNWFNKDDSYLSPSAATCKWCRAKAKCPALNKVVTQALTAEITDLTTADVPEQEAIVRKLLTDIPDLGAKMDAVELIEGWCRAVRAATEGRLLQGTPVAGWKLVQGKRGAREWVDPAVVEAQLKKWRLKNDVIYKSELISPTKAETLLKDNPKRWEVLNSSTHIKQSDGKPSVARVTDPRPALAMRPLIDEISPIEVGADLV